MTIDEKMKRIENTFSSCMMDSDMDGCCRDISSILNSLDSKKKFTITIVRSNNRAKEPFFGMRIFPERTYALSISNDITNTDKHVTLVEMCKRWESIREWEIEIDSRVFDRDIIAFNPEELTAMLLHELGHTVYSDKKMEMFYRAYKECSYRLKYKDGKAAHGLYKLYMIPLTLICGIRNWNISEKDFIEEVFADQSVKKLGYGEHLVSAYSKIIKVFGTSGFKNDDLSLKQVESAIKTCHINVVDLRHRRDKLKDELYQTGSNTDSSYIKNMVSFIMQTMGIRDKSKYDGNIALETDFNAVFDNENYLQTNTLVFDMKVFNALESNINAIKNVADHDLEIATEGLRKPKSKDYPSQLDVDCIMVEVDRMTNHADRRYVLDLIYHQEEKIERFLEMCEYDKKLKSEWSDKCHRMLLELQSCRNAVLSKRSFDKQYKVFVQYPSGYEG